MIPVFEPLIGDEEISNVTDALRRGEISGSFGTYIPAFEKAFAEFCGTRYAVAVSSGTTALHLAVAAAGFGRGDEILVSASTNVATALAAYNNGATVVPVDSGADTWNLDPDLIEGLITEKTKAIIPVHLFGHPADMDAIVKIASKHNLMVIEDCAESHGALCRGRMTGTFGQMACFSFYANKIITTGEGGMVVTNDEALFEKLKLLRNLAFTQPRFRHEVAGFNFRMTGYQAAMGLAQVKKIESIIETKRQIAAWYHKYLQAERMLQLPCEKEWARNVYWMYAVVLDPSALVSRDELMTRLSAAGIETRTFFCPMNLQPFLIGSERYRDASCPVAEKIWKQGLYLPSSLSLKEEDIRFISGVINEQLKS